MSGRRAFLALAAGAVGAGTLLQGAAAYAADHPDGELLALCASMDELARAYLATDFDALPGAAGDAASAEQGALFELRDPVVERLIELPPTTLEGHRARARSMALWNPDEIPDGDGCQDGRLIRAILRDIAGDQEVGA